LYNVSRPPPIQRAYGVHQRTFTAALNALSAPEGTWQQNFRDNVPIPEADLVPPTPMLTLTTTDIHAYRIHHQRAADAVFTQICQYEPKQYYELRYPPAMHANRMSVHALR
jgi:hypothetical protein